jgi:hypothetical protein
MHLLAVLITACLGLRNHWLLNTSQVTTVFACGLVVSMLASGTQVHGFKPGRSRRIFGRKNPGDAFPRMGSKTVGPMS